MTETNYSIMKLKEFFRIIDIYKRDIYAEDDYFQWLEEPFWKNYVNGTTSPTDVKQVEKFLFEWKMGRVIGKIKKELGEKKFLSLNIEKSKTLSRVSLEYSKTVILTLTSILITLNRK